MIVSERSLLDSLQAYVNRFEKPTSREDLLAIASSILTFQQKQGSIAIAPNQAEALIQQVVDQFKATTESFVIEATTDTLVQEVNGSSGFMGISTANSNQNPLGATVTALPCRQ